MRELFDGVGPVDAWCVAASLAEFARDQHNVRPSPGLAALAPHGVEHGRGILGYAECQHTIAPNVEREAVTMGVGGCIVLLAVGAILTFAVDWDMPGMNVHLVGVILMIVGFIGILTYVSIFKRRRTQPPSPAAPVVDVEETRRYR